MELDLCLGLPNHSSSINLDCNSSSRSSTKGFGKQKKKNQSYGSKRVLVEDYESFGDVEVESKAMPFPLVSWNDQPNEEDDDTPYEKWRKHQLYDHESNNEEDEEIVGWPPINTLRKELLHKNPGPGRMAHFRRAVAVRNSSMFVKVKMEGVAIGRKIDLRLYNSYQSFTESLTQMFEKYNNTERNNAGDYKILYQDKEGDWMLAGDVSWETFIESVQRIEILRIEN